MCNKDLRNAINESGFKYWQIADALNIAPNTFTVWMRHELDPMKKKMVMDAIEQCKKSQRKEG